MGHPIFDVKQSYDKESGQLVLDVKQIQKRDVTSLYPQVEYFETPVDIEIVTATGAKIETRLINATEENVFKFELDGPPLLVDFDNEGTLIKEVKFEKSMKDLMYQARNDRDIVGRGWAMSELADKASDKDASAEVKSQIVDFLRDSVKQEKTWQLRRAVIQSIRSLLMPGTGSVSADSGLTLDPAMTAMLVQSASDSDARVRSQAISFLGMTKNPVHYKLYEKAVLSDKSYNVIDAAAVALALTKNKDAYFVLRKLAQTDSWRNRVQRAGLNGLAELGDKRALDLGLKYASEKGVDGQIMSAALAIVAGAGSDDPRAFDLIFGNFEAAFEQNDFQSVIGSLRALTTLGDPRGQKAFDLMKEKFKDNPGFMGFITRQEGLFKAGLKK
jgi:aminopeptidase N